jgi:hypothetical protein
MSKKNLFKPPCGNVEMQVLEYLAGQKESLIEPIQKSIHKQHYRPVFHAVKRLVKNGLLEKGKIVKSHPSYKLSWTGVVFVLAYSKDDNVLKQTVRNYEEFMERETHHGYVELEKKLKPKTMLKLLRWTGRSVLNFGESAFDIDVQLSYLLAMRQTSPSIFTASEFRELKRVGLVINEVKDGVQRVCDRLNAYLRGDMVLEDHEN